MAFVPTPSHLPTSVLRSRARCPPTMIRAPPVRPPTPAATPARIPLAPTVPSNPRPSVSAAAAVAAAAAAVAASTATAPVDQKEAVVVTPSTKTDFPIKDQPTARTVAPTRDPALPRTDGRVKPRPDGTQIANAAYDSSDDAAPRELYYGAPLTGNSGNSNTSAATLTRIRTEVSPTRSLDRAKRTARKDSRRVKGDDAKSKSTAAKRKGRKVRKGVTDDSIRSYLQEIGEVKLLDADSEIDLARQISKLLELERISAALKEETGKDPSITEWAAAAGMDMENFRDTLRRGLRAKEHMVAANLRLVVSIAKKYVNRGLTFQDLIQEGSVGLIRGAEKFDGDKGFKFSTYATWWIRQAITRAIADHSRPIRLPVHVNDSISAIKKMSKVIQDEVHRPPTETELANRLHITVEKLRFLSKSSRATISLETPISREGRDSSATLGSFIVWEGDTPEEATMKNLLREDLENVLNTLSPRERDVVRMRYGFDDGKMKTLEEIGSIFAVTRERIRQIEAKALRKLRHPNRNAMLREYVYQEQ